MNLSQTSQDGNVIDDDLRVGTKPMPFANVDVQSGTPVTIRTGTSFLTMLMSHALPTLFLEKSVYILILLLYCF